MALYLLINICIYIWRFVVYYETRNYDGTYPNVMYMISRANGITMFMLFEAGDIIKSPGVNFTTVLRKAFRHTDSKTAKKTDSLTVFLVLLGSVRVKAARKLLVKSTPELINVFTSSVIPTGLP